MVLDRSIALVGMPGGGKTTVGRQLAKRLGWRFIDLDALIENKIGCSIRAFFERQGEEAFREIEAGVVAEVSQMPCAVLGTGGGVVLRPENRERLKSGCRVVYLRSTPEELYRRLRHDQARPLLQVADPLSRLRQMHEERDPLYRATADFVVDTGRPSVGNLVNMVLMQLELSGDVDPSLAKSPVESIDPSALSPRRR